MNIQLDENYLGKFEKSEIEKLLLRKSKTLTTDLEQLWYLMDLVWDDYNCDNRNLDWKKITLFYSHPVWLLNGFFSEQDLVSMGHRNAISDWILENNFENIVDYGGGFGALARLIAKKRSTIKVNIFEPYPSEFGLKKSGEYNNITIIDKMDSNYDCIVCVDVLEHVTDPIVDLSLMIQSVNIGGFLVIQNAFYPMIKCHLPQNFHFRYSFELFAKMMGLEIIGNLKGSYATIFKKVNNKNFAWRKIRFYEKLSRKVFPLIEITKPVLRPFKRLLNRC